VINADQCRFQPEPRRADRDIGRAAADGFRKGTDIFQPRTDLLTVKVDGRAADGDHVECRLRL